MTDDRLFRKVPSFRPLEDPHDRVRARKIQDEDEGVNFLGARVCSVPAEYHLLDNQIKDYSTKDMLILSDGGAILERIAPNGLSEISENRQFLLSLYMRGRIDLQITDEDIRLQEIRIPFTNHFPNPISAIPWAFTLSGALYRPEQALEAASRLKTDVKAIACIVKLLPDDGVAVLANYWREAREAPKEDEYEDDAAEVIVGHREDPLQAYDLPADQMYIWKTPRNPQEDVKISDGGYTFRRLIHQDLDQLSESRKRLLNHFLDSEGVSIKSGYIIAQGQDVSKAIYNLRMAVREIACITTLISDEVIEEELERIKTAHS